MLLLLIIALFAVPSCARVLAPIDLNTDLTHFNRDKTYLLFTLKLSYNDTRRCHIHFKKKGDIADASLFLDPDRSLVLIELEPGSYQYKISCSGYMHSNRFFDTDH